MLTAMARSTIKFLKQQERFNSAPRAPVLHRQYIGTRAGGQIERERGLSVDDEGGPSEENSEIATLVSTCVPEAVVSRVGDSMAKRATLARISSAVFVQTNTFGRALVSSM